MTELQAGAELDAEIARRVFGIDVLGMAPCHHDPDGGGLSVGEWDNQSIQRPVHILGTCDGHESFEDGDPVYFGHSWCLVPCPLYSTDIAEAWLVVEKMREMKKFITLSVYPDDEDGYWCSIDSPYSSFHKYQAERCNSASLAICRAALAALSNP